MDRMTKDEALTYLKPYVAGMKYTSEYPHYHRPLNGVLGNDGVFLIRFPEPIEEDSGVRYKIEGAIKVLAGDNKLEWRPTLCGDYELIGKISELTCVSIPDDLHIKLAADLNYPGSAQFKARTV